MLKGLYVDNYKSLVNFDLCLGKEQLFLGSNGTGKSTVFEVLSGLRELCVFGTGLDKFLPSSTLTRWQSRSRQTFEFEFSAGENGTDTLRYRLEVEHNPKVRIAREEGYFNHRLLFSFDGQEATVVSETGETKALLADGSRPILSQNLDRGRPEYEHIGRLAGNLWSLHVVRVRPDLMEAIAKDEDWGPNKSMSNYAAWYRHLLQEEPEAMAALRDTLREVLPGFQSLSLKSESDGARILTAQWRVEDSPKAPVVDYAFGELSDGQKSLIALYTLMYANPLGGTLCIDEPDNFVALREIQPLLMGLREHPKLQVLLISHHPELINEMARQNGVVFERIAGGPIRTSPWRAPPDELLTPAEAIARGMTDA